MGHAVVAQHRAIIFSGQGAAATVANKPGQKPGFPPARPTKPVVGSHRITAGNAAWRENRVQQGFSQGADALWHPASNRRKVHP